MYNSRLWIDDLNRALKTVPELKKLAGKSVMVVGATGLIGSSIVDMLIRYNEIQKEPIIILAAGRLYNKIVERFKPYVWKAYFKTVIYDISESNNELDIVPDYIIYSAGNAFPDAIVNAPVETLLGNFLGMKYLLDYAKEREIKRVLYISSSEIYGNKENEHPYLENEYGYIDILNPRNAYSVGKRATESLCISYANEYGIESVIVRPGHIYGPTASPKDNRVSSAWAYAAAYGKDIIMKSDGSQLRSYCYCLDCASAILKVLIKGKNIHAYNISNPNSIISIKQIGEFLSLFGGVNLVQKVAIEEDRKGFNPMKNSSLCSDELQKLGWNGIFSAEEGFSHTVSILKECVHAKK